MYFVHFPQVSPVLQFHLYTTILQFPSCFLIQKQFEEDLIWAVLTAQGLVKHFLENSQAAQGKSNLGSVDCTGSGETFSREFSSSSRKILIWAVLTAQGLVKRFLENSHEQSL